MQFEVAMGKSDYELEDQALVGRSLGGDEFVRVAWNRWRQALCGLVVLVAL